ncbi:MAG: SDR family NAD(P)-dependent oxidoreductase [Oscillospiraceae bacterium]|nr:SDR family NAD(P)-dependent oxidoreductase [Oscillospiraceae bacterium]
MRIAVITGASSGMGREFVYALDKAETFDELWVIARRRERLDALQEKVRAKIRALPMDLTEKSSLAEYRALLEKEKPDVAVLVNGSGFGRFSRFEDVPLEEYDSMIDLNDKALVGMTYVTLPYMSAGAKIYQIVSQSAFQPVPYINVYGATKAFALSFTRALGVELKPRGIRAMAVCPGWVGTEFFDRAKQDDTVSFFNKVYAPDAVVRTALRDMEKGKDVSVHGWFVKLQRAGSKLFSHRLVMRVWMKQQHHEDEL